jgi:serine/threonine protein kinase
MSGVQALRPGDVLEIAGYRLLGRLGEGGMGTVYLAESAEGQQVAVKVIRDHLLDRPEFRVRFGGEVERAKNVPPFCTAEVLDADPEHEPPYLVVEYVDGPTLADIVRESGPLSGAALHSLGIGMATALTAIHNCGVIHRDLKPANVLLPRGGVKVIDFGLARESADASQLTRTDQVMGTIPYISPERLGPSNRPVTPAADVFSWGAVMVYAATGHTPFGGDTPAATAVRIMTEEPDLDGVSPALREVIADTLQKDPADRPAARELLDRLVLLGSTTNVPKDVLRPAAAAQAMEPSLGLLHDAEDSGPASIPRRRRSLLLMAGLAAVAVLAAGGMFASSYLLRGAGENADHPSTPSLSPSVTAEATPSTAPSESPTATPLPQLPIPAGWYQTIPNDPLTVPQYWIESSKNSSSCRFRPDGLTVTTTDVYLCRKASPVNLRDIAVSVKVKLTVKGTCAAVWFRYSDKTGGYAVRICENALYLYEHRPSDSGSRWTSQKRSEWTLPANAPLRLQQVVQIGIIVSGDRITLFADGESQGERPLSLGSGILTMGVFETGAHKGTYSAVFSDFTLWEGPPASPSPSAGPSQPVSPSASPSRSPSTSPSPQVTATP